MQNTSQIAPKKVEAFVGKAHGDLTKVKELLEEEPELINTCWD